MDHSVEREWEEQKFADQEWVHIQKKTFTRWANTFLKERMLQIQDLGQDLSNGLLLINLLEIISSKSLGKFNKNPKLRPQLLENNGFALKFLQKEGIKLVNIGAEDIVDGHLKLILGLIWTIILRYQINIEEGKSARSALLEWVRKQIPEYDIKNFNTNWNDGKAICALANSLKPGICAEHWDLDPHRAFENATRGTDLAEQELEIPKVLAPEDMINPNVDELSMMTYISYFRDWETNQLKKKQAEEVERIPVAGLCRASGPGWEKGETFVPTYFTIEAINAFKRRVPRGGAPFVILITSANNRTVPSEMIDHDDGTYTVNYKPVDAGRHNLTVTLDNKHISNSPKTVPVTRTGADARNSIVKGPGVADTAPAGVRALFMIEARTQSGDRVPDGGDPFQVKVEGPYKQAVEGVNLTDNKDGTYSSSYIPNDFGEYTVFVTLKDEPVADSPYRVNVERGDEDADATKCRAFGPGLEKGQSGESAQFTVEVRNKHDQLIGKGGFPIDVDVYNPKKDLLDRTRVVDNHDGTFTVSYEPMESGVHTVEVVLRHKFITLYYDHIQDSPFQVPIEAGSDSKTSLVFGPGIESGVPTDTLPTEFTIQARDKDGNNIKRGGDPFQVKIQGPTGEVPAKVTDNEDGTYHVDYSPIKEGKHTVNVTLKNKPVANSPYQVLVRQGADENHSFIEGYSFVIQAKSKENQIKRTGGDNFTVTIDGPNGQPINQDLIKVVDSSNGIYTVNYKFPSDNNNNNNSNQSYKINVLLNGKHIRGSPFTQQHS